MTFVLTLIKSDWYFISPQGLPGWGIWLAVALIVVLLLIQWRQYHPAWNQRSWVILAILLLLLPLTALFFGAQLRTTDTSQILNSSGLRTGSLMMFLSAVPWVLAAGLLGPVPTAILAAMSGAVIASFDSHNPFIPLIYALLGAIFSYFLQQNYRPFLFRLISHPLVAAVLVSLGYPILFVFSNLVRDRGVVGERLDIGISNAGSAGLAFAGQLFIAAVVAELISLIWTEFWVQEKTLKPSPAESSLEVRLVFTLTPLVVVIMILILVGQWISISKTTQELLGSRIQTVADASAESIPIALETGQNLVNQLTMDPRLYGSEDPEQTRQILAEYLSRVPFFNQFIFLDANQDFITGYPVSEYSRQGITPEELEGIGLAFKDVFYQSYSLQPEAESATARLVFISTVRDDQGVMRGVVLGRTSLDNNPFFTPVIENLNSLTKIGGNGMLLDEQGMILVHQNRSLVGTYFLESRSIADNQLIPDHTALDGTHEIIYKAPVPGRLWEVVTTIPGAVVQQAALTTVLPLLGLMALLLVVGYLLLRLGLRVVIGSIRDLAEDARIISEGNLDHTLETKADDELGQLGNALEGMRKGLKARVEEANLLLDVSRGVASALEMQAAVSPILEGVLATGASSARLVLTEAAQPEFSQNVATEYSLGPSAEKYSGLDTQILTLTEQQAEVVLTNPARARLNNYGKPLPMSLIAMALKHEGVLYGMLWVAYDEPKQFSKDDIRFVSTIAGQAALAAANTRLYLSAELGRQRMEAILSSTGEPVLVTDYQDNLLLINPAAKELFGGDSATLVGRPVREIISEQSLRELLLYDHGDDELSPVEVNFQDGRVYYATASPVEIEGKRMGRVCLLRDITHYKELDALKTEFVDTVSHDLRSPLSLMRGYATMLQMVGELNEQQTGYLKKIFHGVESMLRLVNNLLDLGRIEAGVGLRLEIISAAEVLKQAVEELRLVAVQKQIALDLNFPMEATPLVQADEALLEQALHNIIENAIKYTDSGGRVEVALFLERDDTVLFVVRDNGIGIAPVDIPRLFDRFFRATGRKTSEPSGSGLGLAIVKSIAERHGGNVQVESRLGRGTTFSLRIPLRQP